MKSIRIVATFPESRLLPTHRLVCDAPAIDRELVLEGRTVDGVETVLSYVEGDVDPYERLLADLEATVEYDVRRDPDGAFVYARTELDAFGRSLASAFDGETLVLVPPVEFRPDRTMRLTLVGHSADLQATVDAFPDPLSVEVRRIGDHGGAVGRRLTDRQREALAAARAVGYYEVPRSGDLEAVAEELDCATATASELLRRAEARLVDAALDPAA